MITYTLTIVSEVRRYRANRGYRKNRFILYEHRRVQEYVPSSKHYGNFMHKLHCLYVELDGERNYIKFSKPTNPLKQTRKLIKYRMSCLRKRKEMEAKGFTPGRLGQNREEK